MTMVEIDSGLVCQGELVSIGAPRFDRPLRHSWNSIIPVFVNLIDTVPSGGKFSSG